MSQNPFVSVEEKSITDLKKKTQTTKLNVTKIINRVKIKIK